MKRLFDFIVSLTLLVLLSPVIALTFITIYLTMGKPVLFNQVRPGLHGKPFVLHKFRTMLNETDENISPDQRLTPVGRFLRSTSIDEIPQLWNVLKGEMSLVGPRPLLMEYLDLYTSRQALRHHVLPGITGWAQVNGRNNISWEEKFEKDVWYVENQSFLLDLKILWLTFLQVVRRKGIEYSNGSVSQRFHGSTGNKQK